MHGKQLRQNNFDFTASSLNKWFTIDKKLHESIYGKDPESYFRRFSTEEELLNSWLKEAKMRAKRYVDDERKKGRTHIENGPRGRRGRAKKKDTASSSVHLENANSGKRGKARPEIGDKISSTGKTQQVDQQTIKQDAYRDYIVNQPPPPPFTLLTAPNSAQSHQTEPYDQANDSIYEINLNDTDLVSKNSYYKLDNELLTSSIVDVPPDQCNLNDATLNEITDLIVLPASSNVHHQSKGQEAFGGQRSDIDLPYHLDLYDCQFNQALSLIESSDLVGTNDFIPA